jgi:ribosome biogenesis GTPase A
LLGFKDFTLFFSYRDHKDLKNGQPKQIVNSDKQLLKIYANAESSEITIDVELLRKAKKEPSVHVQPPSVKEKVTKLYQSDRNLPTDLYRFVFTVVGDMNVGKSCIMNTLVTGEFNEKTRPTIGGAEFGSHRFEIEPSKFI